VQSADLIHTHDELAQQFECEICLKVGSGDDFLISASTQFDFIPSEQTYQQPEQRPRFAARLPQKARSPPLA